MKLTDKLIDTFHFKNSMLIYAICSTWFVNQFPTFQHSPFVAFVIQTDQCKKRQDCQCLKHKMQKYVNWNEILWRGIHKRAMHNSGNSWF